MEKEPAPAITVSPEEEEEAPVENGKANSENGDVGGAGEDGEHGMRRWKSVVQDPKEVEGLKERLGLFREKLVRYAALQALFLCPLMSVVFASQRKEEDKVAEGARQDR